MKKKSLNPNIKCWKCNLVGHKNKSCHTLKCFKCKGFGHKAINCKGVQSTCKQEKNIHENFGKTRSSNTSRKEMKKVWRRKKKSPSAETKDSLEKQYFVDSRLEGREKDEAPNQGEHPILSDLSLKPEKISHEENSHNLISSSINLIF